MHVFEAVPKQWGNSLGITIPKDIVDKEKLAAKKKTTFIVVSSDMDEVSETFGTLKINKPTEQIMDEIDEGYD